MCAFWLGSRARWARCSTKPSWTGAPPFHWPPSSDGSYTATGTKLGFNLRVTSTGCFPLVLSQKPDAASWGKTNHKNSSSDLKGIVWQAWVWPPISLLPFLWLQNVGKLLRMCFHDSNKWRHPELFSWRREATERSCHHWEARRRSPRPGIAKVQGFPSPPHNTTLPIPSGMIISTPSLPDREPFFCSAQNVSSLLGVWNDFPILVTKSGLPFSSCYIINIYCLFNSSFPVSYLCILFLIGLRVLSGNN